MFKAVLFDLDGTVVDSVPAWHKTFNQALEYTGSAGISYKEFCDNILGQSTEQDIERFFPSITEEELIGLYDRFFPEHIPSVRLFPESMKVLDYLESKGLLKGIVTNTPRDLMLKTLEMVGVKDRFDVIVGGTDVSVGKPDPEMIHKACGILGLDEGEVLMVGDTVADMEAGRSAGCRTVGVGVDGDWRIESLGGLLGLFEDLMRE
jgi:HAD superfamily hydrolase (TIGR01549 family)